MISSFDVENLQKFLKNFYTAVGIRISVFDDEFHLVTEYPETPPAFCALVRSCKQGLSGCKNCDQEAFQTVKKRRSTHIYTCHAGLTEAVAPIRLGDGILGYVILAHMLPKEHYEESLKNALQKTQALGFTEEQITPALKKIKTLNLEKINACVEILNAAAAYLQINNLVKWNTENVASKIDEYITMHLYERINSDCICKSLLISRTKLYQISTQCFGMSISQYILFKRIEKAKTLLKEKNSVAFVAERTGFSDYNYFGKVFKKEVGVSPTDYKKTNTP